MGLFSKLKDNFSHGGVDVSMVTPPSISSADAQMTVRVTLASTSSAQQVNKITVKLVQVMDQPLNTSSSGTSATPSHQEQYMGGAEYTTPFTLQAGAPVSLDIVVPLQLATYTGASSSNPVASATSQIAERLEQVSNVMGQQHFKYEVVASADVEGVSGVFDPGCRNQIEVLHVNNMLQ